MRGVSGVFVIKQESSAKREGMKGYGAVVTKRYAQTSRWQVLDHW